MLENIIENITRAIFGLICHQDASILLTVDGKAVFLCPRCIGLHFGFFISYLFLQRRYRGLKIVIARSASIMIVISLVVLALDWAGGHLGYRTPTATSRLITGLLGGTAFSVLVTAYRRSFIKSPDDTPRRFTAIDFGILITPVLAIGMALVNLSGWAVMSSVMLLAVIINMFVIIHTVLIMFSSYGLHRIKFQTLWKGEIS